MAFEYFSITEVVHKLLIVLKQVIGSAQKMARFKPGWMKICNNKHKKQRSIGQSVAVAQYGNTRGMMSLY